MKFKYLIIGLIFLLKCPELQAQTTKLKMEAAITRYFEKYFDRQEVFFTFYGDVEITYSKKNDDGSYYLYGDFVYYNAANIKVTRNFKCTLKSLLDDWSVKKLEYFFQGSDPMKWVEIKSN